MQKLFDQIEDARSLAQIIVDTVREPLLVLGGNFNILFASGSFHRSFQIAAQDTQNQPLFALDNGAWEIAALRQLLEGTLRQPTIAETCEIAQEFPRIGRRVLRLRARTMHYKGDADAIILLGFEDVTAQRAAEHEKDGLKKQNDELMAQKETLLEEMQHRIVNSLQIIASILMLKARAVTSEETRQHLQDAHRRVMSVATVQQLLHNSGRADLIEIAPYLTKLCASLADSMIGENRTTVLQVVADKGTAIPTAAVSLGLIVTELVINALKYAFPDQKASAAVTVRYAVNGEDWKLTVSDNGMGKPDGPATKGGLGTGLVKALAHQLEAEVDSKNSPEGLSVSITHAAAASRLSQAA